MNVQINDGYITVTGEEKFKTESAFWYALKKKLQEMGHDVIKRLMVRDGHLVSEGIYYIRERSWKWCIWDSAYALRFLHKQFNEQGSICLQREEL